MSSKVLTIVFTDIKGFTERTAASDRDFVLRLRARHDELLKPIVSRYEGKLVKTIGDAFLLTFESPTNAVLCALMMQETLRNFNAEAKTEEKIEIRVAINTGEVVMEGTDVLGEPVNVASRVEGITEANEVWFTEATYLAMNKQEVPTSLVGEFRLKGVPEAMKVYRVVQDPGSDAFQKVLQAQSRRFVEIPEKASTPGASLKWLIAAGVGSLILAVIAWNILGMQHRAKLVQIANMGIEAGRFEESEQALKELLRLDPGNAEARGMVSKLLLGRVRQLAEKKELEGAKKAIDQGYRDFPFLQPDRDVEAAFAVATAFSLYEQGKKDEAMQLVDGLTTPGKEHLGSLLEAFKFYDKTGIHWMRPFQILVQIDKIDNKRMASDTAVLENVKYYLEKVLPEEDIDGFWNFILAHYREYARRALEGALYDSDPEKRTLRWNAKSNLSRLASVSVRLFRFYSCELANPDPDVYTFRFAETVNFFRRPDLDGEFPSPVSADDRLWMASLTPPIEAAQGKVERQVGEWARMNQDVASHSLFLESCRLALARLKKQP